MRVIWEQTTRRRVEWVGAEQETVGFLSGLPSGESAEALVKGDLSAIPVIVAHTTVRAALIGIGLAVIGLRGEQLVKGAVAGAVAIEAFVLPWAIWEARKNK